MGERKIRNDNSIVPEYDKFDEGRLFDTIPGLDDLEEAIRNIENKAELLLQEFDKMWNLDNLFDGLNLDDLDNLFDHLNLDNLFDGLNLDDLDNLFDNLNLDLEDELFNFPD